MKTHTKPGPATEPAVMATLRNTSIGFHRDSNQAARSELQGILSRLPTAEAITVIRAAGGVVWRRAASDPDGSGVEVVVEGLEPVWVPWVVVPARKAPQVEAEEETEAEATDSAAPATEGDPPAGVGVPAGELGQHRIA